MGIFDVFKRKKRYGNHLSDNQVDELDRES